LTFRGKLLTQYYKVPRRNQVGLVSMIVVFWHLRNIDNCSSNHGLIAAGSTAPGLTIPGSSMAKGFRRTFVERCTQEADISFSIVSTHHNRQDDERAVLRTIKPNQSGELALTTTLSTFLTHLLRLHKPFLSIPVPSSHPLLGRDLALCFLGPSTSTSSMGIS
jgi:hypothetical protein